MAEREITGDDPNYEFVENLGSSPLASVATVRRRKDEKIVVCKTIDYETNPNPASREIKQWASLGGEKYLACLSEDSARNDTDKTLKVYMDYYENGNLQKVLDACQLSKPVYPIMAVYWAIEITRGVQACHFNNIIHHDIKPQNILLSMPYEFNDMLWFVSNSPDKSLNTEHSDLAEGFMTWMNDRKPWCHVSDVGLGKFSTEVLLSRHKDVLDGKHEDLLHVAPESLSNELASSFKSDCYSMGCLLYNLFKGVPYPLAGLPDSEEISLSEHYPKRTTALIDKCLQIYPDDRPSSLEILNELSEIYMDMLGLDFWNKTKASLQTNLDQPPPKGHHVAQIIVPVVSGPAVEPPSKGFKTPELATQALRVAIEKNNVQMAKEAIAGGADVNAWTNNGGDGSQVKLLSRASITNKGSMAEFLIDHGAIFSFQSETGVDVFQKSLVGGATTLAKSLYSRGLLNVKVKGYSSDFPLYHAVLYRNLEMVKFFIGKGAPLRTPGHFGDYPIHTAARHSNEDDPVSLDILRYLIKKDSGCVKLLNDQKQTALHKATENKDGGGIITILVEAGSDLDALDRQGRTARDAANANFPGRFDERFRQLEEMKRSRRLGLPWSSSSKPRGPDRPTTPEIAANTTPTTTTQEMRGPDAPKAPDAPSMEGPSTSRGGSNTEEEWSGTTEQLSKTKKIRGWFRK